MSTSYSGSSIPALCKPELEYLAEEQMKAFARFEGKDDPDFKVWKFAAFFLGKKVGFEWLSNTGAILGLSSFLDGTSVPVFDPDGNTVVYRELEGDTILLSKELEHPFVSLGKPRFTLMHECAHHLLHAGYYKRLAATGGGKQVACSIQRDSDMTLVTPKAQWTDDERMEWQANYFASALLMPESRVERIMKDTGWQDDYFQRVVTRCSERSAYHDLVFRLASAFRVTQRMAEIRLDALKFERLPDLQAVKPDPWAYLPPPPKKKRMSKAEREWDRVECSWERAREREMEREARRRYIR